MNIISKPTNKQIILEKYNHFFNDVIKAVVDIEKEIIAIDAELHSDLEVLLLSKGSEQKNLWGINLYLKKDKKDWIEYTALINIRPSLNNNWMTIENPLTKKKIEKIVHQLISG